MPAIKTNAMLHAEEIAAGLLTDQRVNEVLLFGSTARGEDGKDIDLILVVSDADFERFVEELSLTLKGENTYFGVRARFAAAEATLSWWEASWRITHALYDLAQVDVFLLPTNWLGRRDEVHGRFNHFDPEFTRNIATDARRFDPESGEFEEDPAYQQTYLENGVPYTYSLQYGRPAVIIDGPADFAKITRVARKIGAICDMEQPGGLDFVVDFRDVPGRLVGPELYTERALRDAIG